MSLFVLLVVPFAGSLLAAVLPTRARTSAAACAGLVALVTLGWLALLFPQVHDGGVVRETIAWLPSAGLDLAIRIDGFAWMFGMLVAGIGLLVSIYARYYMSPEDPVPRFYAFFLAFMGSMLGIVVSGNLIQLVFFWELTSLFSFLLIGYWYHRADARRGARMALVVTGSGGLCLLAGVLILGHIAGSYELDAVLMAGERIRAHSLYMPALVLVLLGAFTKSAQMPFHFWLPHAMAAPTPVSAYLHSATMVKAGVFLLARLWPVLSGSEAWFWIVGGTGLATLVFGAYAAIFERDLKGLLAYSTISHLGLITLLLGLNSPLGAVAAVFHMMNHATFKASLFMAAGVIDHETGTRDMSRLGGLWRAMPFTATLAMVASAAMAGVPLLNGFLSKEMFFAETVYISSRPWVEAGLPIAATVAGIFAVAYSLRFGYGVFFGPRAANLPREPHEPVRWMRGPIDVLVLICLVVGIFPEQSIAPALEVAAGPVVGGPLPGYSLAVWHGFTRPLAMSLVAMGVGIALYVVLRRQLGARRALRRLLVPSLDGKHLFEAALARLTRSSRAVERLLGTRRLQPQAFLAIALAGAAALASLWPEGVTWGDRPRVPVSLEFILMWSVGMACAIGAAWQAKLHRLAALTMLSVTGLMVCLTFVWFSAPDLALTQLVVESVTMVLFLLGLRWLPKPGIADYPATDTRARLRRGRDLLLAVFTGAGMASLAHAMLTRPAPQSISPFFLERALPEGGGANVVNVILVDFRGFDTMGEITVLAAVALTVFALLRRFRPPRESISQPAQQRSVASTASTDLVHSRASRDGLGYMLVPAVLLRLLLPIAGAIAAYLLMRGHNAPGGGFVAGLVVAIAFIMQYLVAGAAWVEDQLRLDPVRWVGMGLLVAGLSGIGSIVLGYPFLTSHTAQATLPLLGEVHLPSAAFFDLGVFCVVVGATLLILIALAHQSIRSRRQREAHEGAEA
ncbi:MAG TPA: monovalent cation/H+ antiporter subunit A [Usitatibacter sp.]|nr:monovalent cation/H+ antiporter subunit A [Usitatibacter sp.]